MMLSKVLFLELWRATYSLLRSAELQELGNDILNIWLKNFAKILAQCWQKQKITDKNTMKAVRDNVKPCL